jgi:hypothetical protein
LWLTSPRAFGPIKTSAQSPLRGYSTNPTVWNDFARESEVLRLDMSVEEGAKLLISAGLVTPEYELDAEGRPVGRPPRAVTAGGRRVRVLQP